MLHTIVNFDDVFYENNINTTITGGCCRSSNPYDYIRTGYFVDNASLFGGVNNVSFNCNFSGNSSGSHVDTANK